MLNYMVNVRLSGWVIWMGLITQELKNMFIQLIAEAEATEILSRGQIQHTFAGLKNEEVTRQVM